MNMSFMRLVTTIFVSGYVIALYGLIAHFLGEDSTRFFIIGDIVMCLAALMLLPRFIKTVTVTAIDVFLATAVVVGLLLIIFG